MNVSKNKFGLFFKLAGMLITCFFIFQITWADSYKLDWDVLNGGGGRVSSQTYCIDFSMAQSVIGNFSGTNLEHLAGFWGYKDFKSGDANADLIVDIGDIVYLINYVFYGGPESIPLEIGEVNCDNVVDIGDIVYLINYVFYNGPAPKSCPVC